MCNVEVWIHLETMQLCTGIKKYLLVELETLRNHHCLSWSTLKQKDYIYFQSDITCTFCLITEIQWGRRKKKLIRVEEMKISFPIYVNEVEKERRNCGFAFFFLRRQSLMHFSFYSNVTAPIRTFFVCKKANFYEKNNERNEETHILSLSLIL